MNGTKTTGEKEQMIYYYWKDAAGEWRWHLKAANNRIIATSGEGYRNEEDCIKAINLVRSSAECLVKKI
ncbi:MAG TPA: DUF1508 domain-containing protein [Pyrinomonadaceae bacterium]